MKKNRILSAIVALSIIISLFTFVAAEYNGTLSVSAPSSAMPGETFNVTVSIPGGSDAVSGSFNLVYDNTVLEVSTATAGTILKDYNVNINQSYAQNKIRLTFEGEEPLSKGGIALTVSFRALSSASGTAHFECEKFKLLDADYNTISTTESASADTFIINDASTVISIDCPENAQSGDTKEVLVKVENPLNICGGSFNLVYDAEKFTLSSATAGSLLSSFSKQINKTYAENKVRVIFAGSAAVQESGTLVKFVFTVNDGAAGTGEFSLEKLKISDSNGVVLECAAEKAQMIVTCLHNHMEWTVTTPATCTEDGVETYLCGCGYANGTRTITKTGHEHFDWITSIEPTCIENGMEEYACLKCGYVEDSREIAATGHQHMEWVTTVDETCENEGVKEYKCADCGYVERTENVPAHGHIYEDVVTPPTKTDGGYTTHTCKSCGISYTDSETPALGFDITFNANGGNGAPDAQNKKAGQSISISETAPTRNGYTFVGWATSADATEAEYYGGNEYIEDADMTLYAVWSAHQHTVTYIVDGEVYKVQTYDFDALIETESEPVKEGYTFSGWSDMPIKMPDNNVEVTGSFAINTYTLSFNANGGDNAPEAVEAEYGTQLTISAIAPSKANSAFVGWAKMSTARKADVMPSGTLTLTGDTTLYALWTDIWDGNTPESITLQGAGTKTNPYRISNATELAFVADRVNTGDTAYNAACYIQTAHIALNDTSNVANWETQPPENEWMLIGTPDNRFKGVYDGNNYTVRGVYINKQNESDDNSSWQGLFGFAGNGAVISNVYIMNSYIHGYRYVSGILGGGNGVTIKNCRANCTVSGNAYVGGIAGAITTPDGVSNVIACNNTGSVSGVTQVGGIVGYTNNAVIEKCYNGGNVFGSQNRVGGIAGYVHDTNITYSYNYGKITAELYDYAGIAGYTYYSTVSNCCNYGNISGNVNSAGGIVGSALAPSMITQCYNAGIVSNTAKYAGGICGYDRADNQISYCINVGTVSGQENSGAISGLAQSTVTNCYYLSTCGAAGAGTSLTYEQMQNTANLAGMTNTGANINFSSGWTMGENPYTAFPSLKGMTDLVSNPIELDLNGGYLDEYTYSARIFANGINSVRNVEHLVIYTSNKESDNVGCEVIVDARNVVVEKYHGYFSQTIPNGGFKLSGNGIMDEWLQNNIEIGDKVTYDPNNYEVKVYKKNPKFTYATGFITYLPSPHKDGYVFSGWYDENNNRITLGTKLNRTGTLAVRAKWTVPTELASVTYNGNTYMLFDDPTSWDSAENYCEKLGGHLVTITSAEENAAITELMSNAGTLSSYYIGSNDSETEGTFKWITGEASSYTNWASGEPNDSTPSEDAGVIKRADSKWNDHKRDYNSGVGFICEIENLTPANTMIYNGHYYQSFDKNLNWKLAKTYCESIGGHLATATSTGEDAAIKALVEDQAQAWYWLGGTDENDEGNWRWITGEEWSYSNWNTGEPSNYKGNEDYLHIYTKNHSAAFNGFWNDSKTIDSRTVGFICEFDSVLPTKTVERNGHRYELYDISLSWENAKSYCDSLGGYLTTITSAEEQNIIESLIAEGQKNQYWLGASDEFSEGQWNWVTGEEWNYTNWNNPYQPDNTGSIEHYLQIYKNSHPYCADSYYEWNDSPINNEVSPYNFFGLSNVGFICEYGNTDEYSPVGSINYNGHYYELYNNVLSWNYAENYCEQKGGHLVTITDNAEQDAVMSLISNYNNDTTNFNCYWMGGNDLNETATPGWITGEPFEYTNWSNGNPGGGKEHWMDINASTGKWYDYLDTFPTIGFICEYDTFDFAPVNELTYNGHSYKLFDNSFSWKGAKAYCESLGGHLATITSAAEQSIIEELIENGSKKQYWLGATDESIEDRWKWVTGEAFEYSNWATGEPNNDDSENYLQIFNNFRIDVNKMWNDSANNNRYSGLQNVGFICEFDAEDEIKVGDYVQMGTYYDEPILWRCVSIDHNGPLMLSDKILCLKAFDAAGDDAKGSHTRVAARTSNGSNYWADSNIRDWLNSDASAGNIVWSCGNTPNDEHVDGAYNSYENEAGFKTNFSSTELALVKSVLQDSILDQYEYSDMTPYGTTYLSQSSEISTIVQNAKTTAYREQVIDDFFLLDVNQVFDVYSNGSILGSYYYIGLPTKQAVNNSEYSDSGLSSTKYWNYWLRTPGLSGFFTTKGVNIKYIKSDGNAAYTTSANKSNIGIRPAFYLDSTTDTSFNGMGTASRPYTISNASGGEETETNYSVYYDSILVDTVQENGNFTVVSPTETDDREFLGVSVNPNSNDADYNIGDTLTITSDTYLYPVWSPVKPLKVTYVPKVTSEWTEWSTEPISEQNGIQVETIKQYRYRDIQYTTRNDTNCLDGWELSDTQSSTGSWSPWSATAVTPFENISQRREVESKFVDEVKKTTYNYFYYYDPSNQYAGIYPYSSSEHSSYHHSSYSYELPIYSAKVNGYTVFGNYYSQTCFKCGTYGNTEPFTQEYVASEAHTEYRYRDTFYTYNFVIISEWSDWGTYAVQKPNREIEERTLYRSRNVIGDVFVEENEGTATVTNTIPKRARSTFIGWSTLPNSETAQYYAGDELSLSRNTYLYGVWNESPVINVTYKQPYDDSIIKTDAITEEVIVTDFIPQRDGYVFLGWATDKNATGAEYVSGNILDVNQDIMLYAVWKEGVTYSSDGLVWNVKGSVLTVLEGEIDNYTSSNPSPWNEHASNITKIVISNGITAVGDYAFYRFANVTEVELADSVKTIGKYAFSNCSSLETIDLSKVTSIGDYAFRYCSALDSAQVSKNTTYGNSVFANSGVDSVTIESGIKKIPSNAFVNCEDIANVTIPISVTDTNNAFSGTHINKITYAGIKAQFEKIMDGLSFDEVECLADSETYYPADFEDNTVPVESITLDSQYLGLEIGDTPTLTATVLPDETTDKTVVWSSSNELVATVNENGEVTALAVGVADITATSADGKVKATCTVYVSKAANSTEPTLYASNVTAKNSETFEVAVSLQNNPGIAIMRIKMDYNENVMSLVNVTDMGVLGSAYHSSDYDTTPYTLYWDNGTVSENFTANGDIAKLTFKVADNAISGEYPITVTCNYDNADALNCELITVALETVDGNVSIDSFKYGDVNGDKETNPLDSAILSRFLAKWSGIQINSDAADVNKDRRVNPLDSAILKRHNANWKGYETLPYVMDGVSLFSAEPTLFSAEQGKITVSSDSGYYGDTADVFVSLEDNPGIVSMRLYVDYDQGALELVGVTDAGTLPGDTHSLDYTLHPYVLFWDNGESQNNITANGNIAKLTFRIKDAINTGNYAVSVSYDPEDYDIMNKDFNVVSFAIVAGGINVLGEKPIKPEITVSNIGVGEKVNCDIGLISPNAISGTVIIGIYNGNVLKELKAFNAQQNINVSMDTVTGTKLKAMWWEGLTNMKPIAAAVEKSLN